MLEVKTRILQGSMKPDIAILSLEQCLFAPLPVVFCYSGEARERERLVKT